MIEMAEYHGFQEQWDPWNTGSASANNWFVQAEIVFNENSTKIAEQI